MDHMKLFQCQHVSYTRIGGITVGKVYRCLDCGHMWIECYTTSDKTSDARPDVFRPYGVELWYGDDYGQECMDQGHTPYRGR